MATRYIATKMAIQGESEYRKALTRINNTQKELQSELKLTQSQFQNNANSMAALTAKGAALNKLFESQSNKVEELKKTLANAEKAEKDYASQKEELSQKIKKNSERLKELAKSTEDTTEESEKLKAENKELSAQLSKVEGNLDAASRGVNSWKTQLNTAEIKLSDLNAEVKLNDEYLDEARKSADGCATSIDRFGDRVKGTAEKADTLSDALGAAGVAAAIKMTADAMAAAARSSIEYESAITGVAKTTDLTKKELGDLTQKIKDLTTEIPATTTVIAGVAEAAGQLGIQKDHLLDFATVMVNLGVATNLTAEEAASALAKFANVVSMSADDYERLGSTIVALGNNFATTEADIVSMATRLASTGAVVGLTEPQIMAIATALSSVGIEAEAGGSAISKLLKQFETMIAVGDPALESFADVAGISADEFAQKWGQDAVGALDLFIQGLGKIDAAGGSSVAVLDELGLTEIRLSNAVLALASSQGILGKSLSIADSAWKENTALAKEAAVRYETTESKMRMLANSANNVKSSIGDKLTPALRKFADAGISFNEWLTDAIDNSGVLIPALAGAATGVTVLTAAVAGYNLVAKAASALTTLFTAAMTANPIGLAVAGIAALAAGVAVFAANVESAIPSVKDLTTEASEWDGAFSEAKTSLEETQTQTMATADVAERYIGRLRELEETGLQTNEQQREYHNILALLCQTIPELAEYIDLENDAIIGGTEALEANTQAWKENAIQQAYQEKTIELQKEYSDILIEQATNQIGLTRAQEKQRAAEEDLEAVLERMNELTDEAIEKAEQQQKETGKTADYTAFLTQEYIELQSSMFGLGSARDDAAHEASIYQKALEDDAEAIEEANLGLAEMDAVFQQLTENVGLNTEATAENTERQTAQAEVITTIQEELQTLAEEYKAAYDAAYQSIDGQIGLFDEFAAKISEDTDTVEEMMAKWAEQTANLATYTENLEKAGKYGLDDGLVASLSDGSAESAGYLNTIIEKIEELGGSTEGMSTSASDFVEEFNASFGQTQEAKESFASTVAGMETDLDDTIQRMAQSAEDVGWTEGLISSITNAFANVGINFHDIGINVGAGLAGGVEESSGDAAAAAADMGSDMEAAAKNSLDIHSPSGVFAEIGHRVGEGAEKGVRKATPLVVTAVREMGETMTESMDEAAESGANAFGDGLSRLPDEAAYQMQAMIDSVISAADGLSWEMEYIGNEIVNGMIRGMENRSYALDQTARRIVNSAIKTTSRTAQVRSPSKRTTEIFENVGEGMVVGLENKRKRVAEKAQSVVDDALSLEIKVPKIDTRMPNIDLNQRSSAEQKNSKAIEKLAHTVDQLGEKVEGFANGAFVLDGDTIVGKWASTIDRQLGASERRKARGLV